MFLTQINAAEDRSPYSNFWFEDVSSKNGMARVTPDTAMRVTAVYACVAVLSKSFAILPPRLYRQNGRKKELVTDHWLYRLLAVKPNRYQNAFQWREMMQCHIALRGNAYNSIITDRKGQITELLPIHPDAISIQIKTNGDYNWKINYKDGTTKIVNRESVWHVKGLAPDIYQGYNPIEVARDTVSSALAEQNYGKKFFANDARPGGWIEYPGTFKDNEAKRKFRESWQEMQAGENRGKAAIMDMGMKFHPVTVSNSDAQFLESRKFSIEDIARLYGVPPHFIGSLDKATFSNIEQQSLEFVTYTMTPIAERFEAGIEADLILEEDADLCVEHDFSVLLRGDSKARSTLYHNGILDGWLVRNEAREFENLNPIDGLDEPLRPLNMVPESEAEDEDQEEDDAEADPSGKIKPKEDN